MKAASPQAPMTDLFMGDDAYHGGAFMLAANFEFYVYFKPQQNPQLPPKTYSKFEWGTTDAYDFYLHAGPISNLKNYLVGASALWDDQVHHDTYDAYWQPRDLAPHMKNIHCAVLTVGGWFDAEDLQGPFSTFHSIDEEEPRDFQRARDRSVGAWWMGALRREASGTRGVHLRRRASSIARTSCFRFSSST